MRALNRSGGATIARMDERVAAQQERVEAARYALLRRLAFAMRHHMVVDLQPIGMITEVLERRLSSAAPDLQQVHDAMAKINKHARAAVQSSIDVVGWLAPQEGKLAALDACVTECVDLLRSQFNFRGFSLHNDVGTQPVEVARCAVRNVLPAALLAVTDRAPSPADVVITADTSGRAPHIDIELRPAHGAAGFSGAPHYRLLEWADVEAIAEAEGVVLEHRKDGVGLVFAA
jgi:hypothetical protein